LGIKGTGGRKVILSCDGGGVRGLATSQFLLRLEEACGKPLSDVFDMFAGTSVGSIVVSSIACKKAPMSDAMEFYTAASLKSIFNASTKDKLLGVAQPDPKFDGKGKTKYLASYFEGLTLQSAQKPVLITTYAIEERKAVILKSTENDPSGNTISVADACDGSSAAPAYFPARQINGRWVVDGGVVANNPSLIAFAEAEHTWPDADVYVISVGTGRRVRPIEGKSASTWGGVQWIAKGLLDIAMDETLTEELTARLLGSRSIRVNSDLNEADDDMDDISSGNLALLIKLGDSWWDSMGEQVLALLRQAGKI